MSWAQPGPPGGAGGSWQHFEAHPVLENLMSTDEESLGHPLCRRVLKRPRTSTHHRVFSQEQEPATSNTPQVGVYCDTAGQRTGLWTPALDRSQPLGTKEGALLGTDRLAVLSHWLPGLLHRPWSPELLCPQILRDSPRLSSPLVTLSGDFDSDTMATLSTLDAE